MKETLIWFLQIVTDVNFNTISWMTYRLIHFSKHENSKLFTGIQ